MAPRLHAHPSFQDRIVGELEESLYAVRAQPRVDLLGGPDAADAGFRVDEQEGEVRVDGEECVGCAEAAEAGADDEDVVVVVIRHGGR